MNDIRVTPSMQLLAVLSVIGLAVAVIASQMPEIRRYLKIRTMD